MIYCSSVHVLPIASHLRESKHLAVLLHCSAPLYLMHLVGGNHLVLLLRFNMLNNQGWRSCFQSAQFRKIWAIACQATLTF